MGSFSVLGFVRAWLLPALLLFALPAFALWFTRHAERTYDARILAVVLPQVDADAALSPDERASAHQFYENAPPSVACASSGDELAHYRENLGETCDDYDQFRAAKSAALAALAIGGFAVLFALGSALLAFVSRPAQYVSLWLGWNVLKVVGALETVLQGGLLVWLSFWMMALWMERYSVKLILVAGGLAAVAAFAVLRAIFQRPASGLDVEGEPLPASAAPELWARIGQLAAELGTSPPDHIVVGIDDNFFVTQSEVRVAGTSLRGRTLYISLSLLRTLAGDEAEAVLAHELAHLLGGDTGHGQKLAPLSARFVQYLTVLHGGITRPIYYFMNAYFALFQLSVGRSRRRAEFAADAAAARVTSADAIARSLIKVGAYASYRGRVEEALFEHDETHANMGIAARVGEGFASYARTERLQFDLISSVTPHPFDSHPELRERIAAVGSALAPEAFAQVLLSPVGASWVDAIPEARAIETRLWALYEERFADAHARALAYRYEPADDDERAHVEKYFPPASFDGEDGLTIAVDYAGVKASDWPERLPFDAIKSAELTERLFKKYLDLKLQDGGLLGKKQSICLSKVVNKDAVIDAFNRYYGRHQTMRAYQAAQAAEAESQAS